MCALESIRTTLPPLRVGMRARVKALADIVATLDVDGRYDGLPFTAEMAAYCGGVFAVRACLNRLYVEGDSVRGIRDVVILDGARCDGAAHGGCGRACHLLWKTAWLEADDGARTEQPAAVPTFTGPCQGIGSILRDATHPLPWTQPAQYLDELHTGSRGVAGLLGLATAEVGKQLRWYAGKLLSRPAAHAPELPTPLNLQPGEVVRIRPWREIARTLDARGKCRGMGFTRGMRRFCGRAARVHSRVASLIDEVTGQQFRMSDTVLLDDILCDGALFRGCPRACHWCWREAWLTRIAPDERLQTP